jgi:hypothetical protein
MAASAALLTEHLEAEFGPNWLEVGEEPDLPSPRADGPLAGLPPAT